MNLDDKWQSIPSRDLDDWIFNHQLRVGNSSVEHCSILRTGFLFADQQLLTHFVKIGGAFTSMHSEVGKNPLSYWVSQMKPLGLYNSSSTYLAIIVNPDRTKFLILDTLTDEEKMELILRNEL